MGMRVHAAAALALGLLFAQACSMVIAKPAPPAKKPAAAAKPAPPAKKPAATAKPAAPGKKPAVAAKPAAPPIRQSDTLATYTNAVNDFKSILRQRRAQIDAKQPLPNLPGQALYLARNRMMGARKDLTDAVPSAIGRPNKFGIPPAYFDADHEPLIDEYKSIFAVMQAPPASAQNSETPFKDVVDLGIAIARAKGLDAANADVAGRISLGLFFAETNGNQNMGNARSNKYKGSFQTGPPEDQNGQNKWAALKASIAAFDPALIQRDSKEEARVGNQDHRYNHWTAVRDGLMNAHAELFRQIPAIVKMLPDPIDQMKFFELIQIVPAPTLSALRSGNLVNHRVSDPKIMGYLRNNSMFAFGHADRAKTSATFREILDAMWLFNEKFEQAAAIFDEIKTGKPATAPKPAVPAKPTEPTKPNAAKPTGPAASSPSASKPVATTCIPAKFRIVLDVGHTAASEGAASARNIPEFTFNLKLAQRIEEKLKTDGFAATRLLVTEGKARPSLAKRVASANNMPADFFLSIHHDSVPDQFHQKWEFEGKKAVYNDRFSGYSIFVSSQNPAYKTSLAFAELLGREMKAQGLEYARQYTLPIMGKNQHPILNKETGVYSYDKLIVLKSTKMPAVLLEGGSISNRDEELQMDSPERRNVISSAVATAAKDFCDGRWTIPGPP